MSPAAKWRQGNWRRDRPSDPCLHTVRCGQMLVSSQSLRLKSAIRILEVCSPRAGVRNRTGLARIVLDRQWSTSNSDCAAKGITFAG